MNNKFVSMLSASNADIKETRAKTLSENTVLEVDSFINNLKREKSQLATRLTNLTDLAPDNTYSLRPGSKDFNAAQWVKELHKTRMDIKLKEIELAEAQSIYDEWFKGTEAK